MFVGVITNSEQIIIINDLCHTALAQRVISTCRVIRVNILKRSKLLKNILSILIVMSFSRAVFNCNIVLDLNSERMYIILTTITLDKHANNNPS